MIASEQEYCDQENARQDHDKKANNTARNHVVLGDTSRISPGTYIQPSWSDISQHCLPSKTLHTTAYLQRHFTPLLFFDIIRIRSNTNIAFQNTLKE